MQQRAGPQHPGLEGEIQLPGRVGICQPGSADEGSPVRQWPGEEQTPTVGHPWRQVWHFRGVRLWKVKQNCSRFQRNRRACVRLGPMPRDKQSQVLHPTPELRLMSSLLKQEMRGEPRSGPAVHVHLP